MHIVLKTAVRSVNLKCLKNAINVTILFVTNASFLGENACVSSLIVGKSPLAPAFVRTHFAATIAERLHIAAHAAVPNLHFWKTSGLLSWF